MWVCRLCMCVHECWQELACSVEVKQLVWSVESELGFLGMTAHPSSSGKCPFWFQMQHLPTVCVLLPTPSCIQYDNPEFSLPLLAALSPFFPSPHCHPHGTALSVEENHFRSPLFLRCPRPPWESSSINGVRSGLLINLCTSLKMNGPLCVSVCCHV